MRGYFFCLLVFSTLATARTAVAQTEDAIISRSVVTAGDTARLQHALAKGRRGEPVTVAVIGGSITAGARASAPEKNYGGVLAQWWRETFPNAKIELVNAGIGATGSNYGALRAQRDLLARRPDFVVVEYGVNDPNARSSAETLEGLIRQILKQPQQPAVVLLFMMHRNGGECPRVAREGGPALRTPDVQFARCPVA